MKILAFTDHSGHSVHNSLYVLMRNMLKHPKCECIDVVSRGNHANDHFFYDLKNVPVFGTRINETFGYQPDGAQFMKYAEVFHPDDYDVIMMRLPRPIPDGFFEFLEEEFEDKIIINRPSGIEETSSKAFLLQLKKVCPPIALVNNVYQINDFKIQHDLVLKPLENYGGKGIVKIEDYKAYDNGEVLDYRDFLKKYHKNPVPMLAMKYLKNVSNGDKRVLVVNGKVLGASLRMPAKGSWLANVSQGGYAVKTGITKEEYEIAEYISPILKSKGIIIFGFDTLEDDNGKRVLSEINTLSIGGFNDATHASGHDVIQEAVNQIWKYILNYK